MHIFSMLNAIFSITLTENDTVKLEAQFNKTKDRIHTLENEMEKAEEKIGLQVEENYEKIIVNISNISKYAYIFSMLNYLFVSITLKEKDKVKLNDQFNKTEDRMNTLENEMEKVDENIGLQAEENYKKK